MQDGNVFIGETTKCDFFLTYFVSVYLLIKKKYLNRIGCISCERYLHLIARQMIFKSTSKVDID